LRVSATTSNTGYSAALASQSLSSLDNFLQLFLTQLQYQNPLEPVKDHEFIAQLAQFSHLEEAQQTNKYLAFINWQMQGCLDYLGLQLLGKKVDVETDAGVFSGLVEAVSLHDGKLKLIVAGEEFQLEQVIHIGLNSGKEESAEGE
jgi:flagellar basal-body rod modification protein FlgD